MEEGTQGEVAFIVKTGSVEVIKSRRNGQHLVLSTIGSGGIIGEMSLIDSKPRSATVRAKEDCDLLVVDLPTFEERLSNLDAFSNRLVRTLIQRLRDQNEQILDLSDPSSMAKAAKNGKIIRAADGSSQVLLKEEYRDQLDFGAINFLFGDSNRQARQSIKGGLHMQGFREIDDVGTAQELNNRVAEADYDLIVLDASLGIFDIAEVINKIRHNETAVNPFAVIFAIVDQPSSQDLEKLANAGLDDVLLKPVSLGNILDRIERRIKNRRPFVVTLDYVGPDRRSRPRMGGERIPLVSTPNPVAVRALTLMEHRQLQQETKAVQEKILDLKIERHAVQVDWLRSKIETLVAEKQDPSYFLDRTLIIINRLIRLLATDSRQWCLEKCDQIVSMIDDFKSGMAELRGENWQRYTTITLQLKKDLKQTSVIFD